MNEHGIKYNLSLCVLMYVCVDEIQPIICCLNLNTTPIHTLVLSLSKDLRQPMI